MLGSGLAWGTMKWGEKVETPSFWSGRPLVQGYGSLPHPEQRGQPGRGSQMERPDCTAHVDQGWSVHTGSDASWGEAENDELVNVCGTCLDFGICMQYLIQGLRTLGFRIDCVSPDQNGLVDRPSWHADCGKKNCSLKSQGVTWGDAM